MTDLAAVERICLAATAHNYGQTVYEITDASGILRVRMSSWPRAKEATDALAKAGYAAAQDGNEVMVLAAPQSPDVAVDAAREGEASVGQSGRDTPQGIEAGLPDANTAAAASGPRSTDGVS